jgi:hypothetical protein
MDISHRLAFHQKFIDLPAESNPKPNKILENSYAMTIGAKVLIVLLVLPHLQVEYNQKTMTVILI